MPPWLNPWLLAAVAMSMALHFLILLVPPLPVSFCPAPILFCDRVQIFLQQSGPVLVTGPLWALLLWKLPGRLGVGRSEGAWCKQLVLWEPSDLGNQRGGDKTPCCGESLEARAGGLCSIPVQNASHSSNRTKRIWSLGEGRGSQGRAGTSGRGSKVDKDLEVGPQGTSWTCS